MLISGLQLRSALNSFGLDSCTPLTASSCSTQETVFINDYYSGAQVVAGVLTVIPILIGALTGGPMVARELETSTFRLSWTKGCGRTRWLIARLALLAVAVTAGAAAVSVMFCAWVRIDSGWPRAATARQTCSASMTRWSAWSARKRCITAVCQMTRLIADHLISLDVGKLGSFQSARAARPGGRQRSEAR